MKIHGKLWCKQEVKTDEIQSVLDLGDAFLKY